MNTHPVAEKHCLRKHLRRCRSAIRGQERIYAERRAAHYLARHIKRGMRIGAYSAVGSELSLQSFFQTAKKRGAHIYLPYIENGSRRLWFTPLPDAKQTRRLLGSRHQPKKWFGIPQFNGKKIRAHHLHLLIVPLVGIDYSGFRIGQGGGFYDTTIAPLAYSHYPKLIGIGFDCQRVPHIPTEAHDHALPRFISEKGEYRMRTQNNHAHRRITQYE